MMRCDYSVILCLSKLSHAHTYILTYISVTDDVCTDVSQRVMTSHNIGMKVCQSQIITEGNVTKL